MPLLAPGTGLVVIVRALDRCVPAPAIIFMTSREDDGRPSGVAGGPSSRAPAASAGSAAGRQGCQDCRSNAGTWSAGESPRGQGWTQARRGSARKDAAGTPLQSNFWEAWWPTWSGRTCSLRACVSGPEPRQRRRERVAPRPGRAEENRGAPQRAKAGSGEGSVGSSQGARGRERES